MCLFGWLVGWCNCLVRFGWWATMATERAVTVPVTVWASRGGCLHMWPKNLAIEVKYYSNKYFGWLGAAITKNYVTFGMGRAMYQMRSPNVIRSTPLSHPPHFTMKIKMKFFSIICLYLRHLNLLLLLLLFFLILRFPLNSISILLSLFFVTDSSFQIKPTENFCLCKRHSVESECHRKKRSDNNNNNHNI